MQLPARSGDDLKAVMVWIHGGGFYMGSGNEQMNGPDFLVTGDVVLVTINYRLGALGKATGLASVTTESAWLGFFT